MDYVDFEAAVRSLGYNPSSLRLEFAAGGSNNNVLGLNADGVPWAVCISFPKTPTISDEKLRSYERLVQVCSFLTKQFGSGVKIDSANTFKFDGNCFLCDGSSTKAFLTKNAERYQFTLPALTYEGPFFVKKGAPASETLESDLAFRGIMLRGLAILHQQTGLRCLVDERLARQITLLALEHIDAAAQQDIPDVVKAAVSKYNTKWNASGSEEVAISITREMLLRSDTAFTAVVNELLDRHEVNTVAHRCFVHGDAHGANFIVVQHGIEKEVHPIDVEDALGLVESEKQHYLVDLVKFAISAHNLSRIFGRPLRIEEVIAEYYIAAQA